jgi:N4-gp56 family major capsid protein
MTNFHFGTTPTQVDSSIPELWAKGVMRDSLRDGFWTRFVGGEGSGAAIIQKSELLNNPGDTIHISITSALTGAGVSGDTTQLVESEETLSTSEKKVIPTLYRHAVRVNRRAQKKSIVQLREEAKLRLAEWGAEKMDDLRFAGINATGTLHGEDYTANFRVAGNAANTGTVADIGSGDVLDVATIQQSVLDMYNRNAKPLRVGGDDVWVLVCHPNSLYALKRSSEYITWVQEAAVRGADNPFFKGAVCMVDGVLIFQHSNVVSATSGVKYAKNILFGREAFVEGLDETVSWDEDTFDYGLEWGVAYSFAQETRRALEKNSMQLYTAAIDV